MTIEVELNARQHTALRALADDSGKTEVELVAEAVDRLLDETDQLDWRGALNQLAGVWAERSDLPDFAAIRREWDRELPRSGFNVSTRPSLDTDVVIDYLRRMPPALSFVKGQPVRPMISVVTIAELYTGVREGRERSELDALAVAFRVVPIGRDIAANARLLRRRFGKSHGVGLGDALIAATAQAMRAQLFTLNVKHFPMLDDVHAPYQKA